MARFATRLILPFVLAPLLLAACGKKKPANNNNDGNKSGITAATKVPDDAKSRDFAERLLKHQIRDFRPADGGEAEFIWRAVTFAPDNSFLALSEVILPNGESFTCEERGAWSMEAAEAASTASMIWKINKTTCTGRNDGVELRAKVSISEGGDYKIIFR